MKMLKGPIQCGSARLPPEVMLVSYRSDVVDLEVRLHHETANAVLVSLDGEEKNAVWIPRSWCEIERHPDNRLVWMLSLPEHRATEKGLV
ncbi:MAG: hypothetical protein KJZ83_00025 [Burkholderiaceae bacterium]|nr:hypothetical protein [Burkholderiaceae bacterium]